MARIFFFVGLPLLKEGDLKKCSCYRLNFPCFLHAMHSNINVVKCTILYIHSIKYVSLLMLYSRLWEFQKTAFSAPFSMNIFAAGEVLEITEDYFWSKKWHCYNSSKLQSVSKILLIAHFVSKIDHCKIKCNNLMTMFSYFSSAKTSK